MTFGRAAEALPQAIRLFGWPKLVISFFFFLQIGVECRVCTVVVCKV